ncbi:MAG: D-hexose-6-phosphate mutarotase [Cellulomonas sp.]
MTIGTELSALPASVRLEPGRGGLSRVVVEAPFARAEVYLQGAHVTSWTPAGADEVIWMSDRSDFVPGAPLRGGVPICFPWFGPDPAGAGPMHGTVRTSDWVLAGAVELADRVVLTFTLESADAGGAVLDDVRFSLVYTVTIGCRLTLALSVTSAGTRPLHYEEAFHTYLAIGDVRRATLLGLGGTECLDRLSSTVTRLPIGAEIQLTGETDWVLAQPGVITVADPADGRSVDVAADGSANAVVWNPWIDKAAAMRDFGDDEWERMVCVETCNVLGAALDLAPGATRTMQVQVSTRPLT